jgi:hypothetical protein
LIGVEHLAAEARLELAERCQILGLDEVRELLADEHDDRVGAEVLVVVVCCFEARRGRADERGARGVRAQPKREQPAADRQGQHHPECQERPARGSPRQPLEPLLRCHLLLRLSAHTGIRASPR